MDHGYSCNPRNSAFKIFLVTSAIKTYPMYYIIAAIILCIGLLVFYFVRKSQKKKRFWAFYDEESLSHKGSHSIKNLKRKQGKSDLELMLDQTIRVSLSKHYPSPKIDDNELRQLVDGFLEFKCPEQMKMGKKEVVVAELFIDKAIYNRADDATTIEEIRISKITALKLFGEDFTIISKSSESQAILDEEKTTWLWDVTPLKRGTKYLELIITAKIKLRESDTVYDLPIRKKTITVQINRSYALKEFWKKNWQWIISTLIGSGVLVVVLKAFKVIT